jgi:hypothetical protein
VASFISYIGKNFKKKICNFALLAAPNRLTRLILLPRTKQLVGEGNAL